MDFGKAADFHGKVEAKEIPSHNSHPIENDLDDENRQNGDDDEVIWRRQGSKGGRQFTFSACDSPSPPPPPAPTPTPPTPAAAAGPLPFSTALAKMCRPSTNAAAGPLLHVCVLALLHIYINSGCINGLPACENTRKAFFCI